MGVGQSSPSSPSLSPHSSPHGKRGTPEGACARKCRRSQIWTDDEIERLKGTDTEESLQEGDESSSNDDDNEEEEEEEESTHKTHPRPHSLTPLSPPPKKKNKKKNRKVDYEVNEILTMRKWRTNRSIGSGGWIPRGKLEALNRAVNSKVITLLSRLSADETELVALVQSSLIGMVGTCPDPEVSSVLLESLERLADSEPELALGFLEPLSQINFQFFLRNKLIVLSQTLLQYSTSLEQLRCLTVIMFRYGSYGKLKKNFFSHFSTDNAYFVKRRQCKSRILRSGDWQ